MLRTRVGYCGGKKQSPTYYSLGDHTETIQIDFDPAQISYAELLELFWSIHQPCSRPWSRQYRSAVFYDGEQQLAVLNASKAGYELMAGEPVQTAIEPLSGTAFWRAEDYHQKYYLRQLAEVWREFEAIYPNALDFTDSTAVTRANGYVGRHVYSEQAAVELPQLGLSASAQARLAMFVPGGVPADSAAASGCGDGVCEVPKG